MRQQTTVLLAVCVVLMVATVAWALIAKPTLGAPQVPTQWVQTPPPPPVPAQAPQVNTFAGVPSSLALGSTAVGAPIPTMVQRAPVQVQVPPPMQPPLPVQAPPPVQPPLPAQEPLPLPLPLPPQLTGPVFMAPAPSPDPLTGWGEPAAPQIDPRRFTEAHWQGLEVIPKTPQVARALGLSPHVPGVIIDDVTLPADLQGFQAGDLVTHVGTSPTPDLLSFIRATERLRDRPQAGLTVFRNQSLQPFTLVALMGRMGTANGETPSMIPPGARMPHPYRGPCTNCHKIGTTGTLPVDQGDLIALSPPTIRVGFIRPHRDRGPCTTCHQVLP